jgi:transcriptional regulator with XRE-family HTH domain
MNFQLMSDQAVLKELGKRIQQGRLDNDISQENLARKAGVGRNVVQNVESGKIYTIIGFVRILRALGLVGELDQLLPNLGPNPLELVKLKGRQRQRASGSRKGRKNQ